MSEKNTSEKLSGLRSLKPGVLLRMALLGHIRSNPNADLLDDIRRINRDLETFYEKMRDCEDGSREEDQCLEVIRELEDRRFHLLSQVSGDRLSEYNQLSPRYPMN